MIKIPNISKDEHECDVETEEIKYTTFAFDSLDAVRRKLLDLSSRNALLNYKHQSSKCIRLIDELPDQIFTELQADKTFCFIPVPTPTEIELIETGFVIKDPTTKKIVKQDYPSATQWAKYKNLSVSFELPAKLDTNQGNLQHEDRNLQTDLFAPELEGRLRKIRGLAETALQETGANVLYLVLGFLEWYESNDSEKPRYAPLFTIPVQIERGKLDPKEAVYVYTIKQKDDGYLTNVTLREKLAIEFGLILPYIDEATLPENYFEAIQRDLLKHQPRWQIKRHATLALLNFTKQTMYRDLDPARWPQDNCISQHPLIAKFFSVSTNRECIDEISYAPEHAIDETDDIHHLFPLIYDADSSQHSAIIDSLRGNNLVIEGPPGTGKSQTITNIIAAAIANGKRVLFVAEKMAALEVVKNRLEKAGLGDFCLELHSHKSNKLQVVTELNNRILKQDKFREPKDIGTEIARYEDLKNKLTYYVELINQPWKNTELTLQQIFASAVRYRQELQFSVEHLQIKNVSGETLTPLRFKELKDNTAMLRNIYKQMSEQAAEGDIANHYWFGVNSLDLGGDLGEQLSVYLTKWNQNLKELVTDWNQVLTITEQPISTNTSIQYIYDTSALLADLPEIDRQTPLSLIPVILNDLELFYKFIAEYKSIHHDYDCLATVFKTEIFQASNLQINITRALESLENLGISDTRNLSELWMDLQNITPQVLTIDKLKTEFEILRQHLPITLQNCLRGTPVGLKEFFTLINIVSLLPAELWGYRNEVYENPDLDTIIECLTPHLCRTTQLQNQLSEYYNLSDLPPIKTLKNAQVILREGGWFSILSSKWRCAKKLIISLASTAEPNFKELFRLLPQLIEYRGELDIVESLNSENNSLGDLYKGIATPIERIAKLRKWYKTVRKEYGVGFGTRVDIGDAIIKLERTIATSISEQKFKEIAVELAGMTTSFEDYKSIFKIFRDKYDSQRDLHDDASPLKLLATVLDGTLSTLKPWAINDKKTIESLISGIKLLAKISTRIDDWSRSTFGLQLTSVNLKTLHGHYSDTEVKSLEICAAVCNHFISDSDLLKVIARSPSVENYFHIKTLGKKLLDKVAVEQNNRKTFTNHGKVDVDEWTRSSRGNILALIARNESAIQNPLWLNTWCDYVKLRIKLSQHGLGSIITDLECRKFSSEIVLAVCKRVIFSQLAKEALDENESLALFSGMEQTAFRDQFQKYDINIIKLQRELVAYRASRKNVPHGNSHGKVSEYTELSLLKHEVGKKTRHVPVRELLKRANASILTLKPCFMMSPMSVAQYLEPGQFNFDLVVMDEASQIRPEDALGSIARGKALIVVGDPKQLPPTSFFQHSFDNEEDGDDVVGAEQSESILTTVSTMFRNRRLRWHYRSRHESLIAFSNKNFYDDNLVIFPSPFQKSDEFGIVLHRVARGRFISSKNVEEAKEIVATAASLLLSKTQDSIGIVAMNAKQKEEIENQLNQFLKDNPNVALAFDKNKASLEPLFIKNLENVQGDERDTILISMTYGPENIGGRTMQRFGPINLDTGERRLNVLFTRSKKQMRIFTSMDSSDVLVSGTSKRGVKALRAFLEYCESKHLHNTQYTGKVPDSDFEVSVIRALENHGYQCEPQLGTAGYFLDIAVRDPGKPGRFLLGIECDGASYHSAKSARDRDRLRQEILEGLGWKIKRIWSTDWFSNPVSQLNPILKELNELKTTCRIIEDEEINFPCDFFDLQAQKDLLNEKQQDIRMDLHQHLINLNTQIIAPERPNTPPDECLLRPAMIEALLFYLPTSRAEYSEIIPPYLRMGTNIDEIKYLDEVLEIIANYNHSTC
jgi:superfamily I DNA and/or RNA helicase/very-short-patch-repair endonuclease